MTGVENGPDEFWQGIWWVPDVAGKVRNATPSECAAEIMRLRDERDALRRSMSMTDTRLIQGALTAASRALASESDFDPDAWSHLFTVKSARCNAAFILALGSKQIAELLNQIGDAVEALEQGGKITCNEYPDAERVIAHEENERQWNSDFRRSALAVLSYVADHTYIGSDAEWHMKPGYDPQLVLDLLGSASEAR